MESPVYLMEPLLHIVERLKISHVVHHDNAMCSSVIATGDGTEAFLSSSIPLSHDIWEYDNEIDDDHVQSVVWLSSNQAR